ncbi:MFS transporter [Salinibacterium soli]|uniref:MFS transporter n=1 Tax=Antiquaquibacter soli TaxID=3064523 RepID=A0ABT9BQ04_9MICO|nr:MFS transporter [Protaetiibacter sp. WY-16]MDO7883097.1 MFS transporter [Protaetiibacter sp. WY-16]
MTTAQPARSTQRRFQLRLALLVALGVFAQESVWNFHDSQTPVTLAEYTTSVALIGLIMGLDNIIGIVVQPLMGYFSDRFRGRWGRRTPFIVVGAPIAALLFVLIPLAPTFPILIAVIVLFSLTANSFKPITEALIADQQVPEHRSKANAVGRFASGLTIIVSALLSLFVVDESVELAYVISAVVMIACFAILLVSLKESRTVAYRAVVDEDKELGRETTGFFGVLKDIVTDRDRSRLVMILAVIVTWGAWAAVRALLTLYGVEQLGLSRGEAGGLTLPASVAFLLVIIPLAILSDRFGRRRVMRIGIIVFAIGTLSAFAFSGSTTATLVGILIAAAGFAGFAANAAVMLWNLAPSQRLLGVYTGIFAVAQAIGSSAGPAAVGGLVDATDWSFLMLFVAVLSLIGLLLTFGVRREYSDAQLAEQKFGDAERAG